MLQKYCTPQLQHVVDNIVLTIAPEKIFLLGVSITQQTTCSIFNPVVSSVEHAQHYYLLILTSYRGKYGSEEIQNLVEQSCRTATPITAFVQNIIVFNEWLLTGHPFAYTIVTEGQLIYNADTVALEQPASITMKFRYKDFGQWYNRSKEFFTGAELFSIRRQHTLAAFLLQQATEFACTGLILMYTGFRVGTHNIDKLLRYTQLFCNTLAVIFPRHTEKEQRLFQLLQDAYIQGRYKYDFTVSGREMDLLIERVQRLLNEINEVAKLCDKEAENIN